jgi:hypothetical protein
MKARRVKSPDAQAGADDKVKVLKPHRLPPADTRRIKRIIKWEDESAAAEFVIAGPRVTCVDPE